MTNKAGTFSPTPGYWEGEKGWKLSLTINGK